MNFILGIYSILPLSLLFFISGVLTEQTLSYKTRQKEALKSVEGFMARLDIPFMLNSLPAHEEIVDFL